MELLNIVLLKLESIVNKKIKINNIQKLKGFLLNDFNSKVNVSKKLKKKINSLGQSMLKNIYLEIRNFL